MARCRTVLRPSRSPRSPRASTATASSYRPNIMRDWLDNRTGFRALLAHLLDEPLPSGVGWWFVTGSIVLFLLSVQLLTGVLLAVFYSPSPDHAYDSVRFIMEQVTFGRVLRGLHFFGASFIVIAAVVHMLRVVAFGSYKKPRELNWVVGVLLLLIILAFALTGYLLPWDQKAYWATTVTLNIARSVPLAGNVVSGLLKGGTDLGALTLMRWYAAHVFLLPACLIVFTVAHIYLMRRHGISGPVKTVPGPAHPFYPYQAIRDTIAIAVVFGLLLTMAVAFNAPLDALADPTDATYVPRPEWYFMSLFELLKHFPGRLEPVATIVIPGLSSRCCSCCRSSIHGPSGVPGSAVAAGDRARPRAGGGADARARDGRGRLQERPGAEGDHRRRVHGHDG